MLLRRTDEGEKLLEEERHRGMINGYFYVMASTDAVVGVCKIFRGHFAEGIRFIEQAILRREQEGYQDAADWYRGILCDIYLQVIAGKEKIIVFTPFDEFADPSDDHADRPRTHSRVGEPGA